MGKQGPCYHCGITYTPLWRNGPPEKPILCNACGSRWRTKGTLANYTPLHARTFEAIDSSDYKGGRGKKGLENSKEQRFHKRKQPGQNAEFGVFGSDSHYVVGSEEDASNRSSSGSGISYSEGCIQYCGTVGTDSAGSVHAPVWDSPIPSKKRTRMYRKRPSSVEKLTKGLRYILHEQDTSYLSFCSESDDLLFQCKAPMVAAEIGIGSVFIRQPQSTPWEEESEASSLLVENKYNTFGVVSQDDSKAVASSIQLHNGEGYLLGKEKEKMKQGTGYKDLWQEHSDRSLMPTKGILDNFPCNKHDVLQSSCSPLIFVELKDIINFDSFMGILTAQDQMHLFKYLSSVDVDKLPESLRSMFSSVQFEEALINFQELLSEGIFDTYELGLNPDVHQSLQNLITTDLSNSKWIERYSELLNRMKSKRVLHSAKVVPKNETKGLSLHSKSGTYVTLKNSSRSETSQVITGSDNNMKSLGNRQKFRIPSSYHESMDTGCISKSTMDFDVEPKSDFCFSPSSLFASPVRRSSILLDSIGILGGESFEQDLLLDVPSNVSFQQAELFHNPDWRCKTSKNSLADAGNNENQISEEKTGINLWGTEDSLEWSSLSWNHSSVQSGQSLPNGAVLYPGKTP